MSSIREVARLAGVSPATVSRVMNNTAKVDEEKAQRVWKAINETGFVPNEVARSLYKKSSRIIGLITPNIENPFFTQLAKFVEAKAYEKGFRLTLCNTGDSDEKEIDNIRMLDRMNADGIILMTNNEGIEKEIKKCKMPIVVLDRQLGKTDKISYIQADHYQGGRLATEHLLACGCKNIVSIIGPQRYSSSRARYRGYCDVCEEKEIKEQYMECEYAFQAGLEVAEELLSIHPNVDGVIACNDMVALSIYKVFHRKGIAIPDQVQLIGFDNIELSYLMTPELTTIAQPFEEMGNAAMNAIIAAIGDKKDFREETYPVQLIQRETTIPIQEKTI